MDEISDELTFVSIDGRQTAFVRAELIHASWGWQVELRDVPVCCCPTPRQIAGVALETLCGSRCEGRAIADLVAPEGAFVLLSGIGHLRRIAPADAA